jgi:hypothetical protein
VLGLTLLATGGWLVIGRQLPALGLAVPARRPVTRRFLRRVGLFAAYAAGTALVVDAAALAVAPAEMSLIRFRRRGEQCETSTVRRPQADLGAILARCRWCPPTWSAGTPN